MGRLIIDGNSVCHAAHNSTKLTVGSMQTQAIFGMLKSMRVLSEKFPMLSSLVLWDGEAKWRKEIYPEYKANRKAKDEKQLAHKEAYKAQSPFVRKALSLIGVPQMFATTREADDMAGLFIDLLDGQQIVLVSGDQDWLQLVRPGVTWFDPIRDNAVNVGSFTEFTGYFSPEEFLQGKALRGDTSDNIAGVGGIGEKGAPEFLAQFKTVENFFRMCDNGEFVPKKVAHKNLASPEGRAAFARNMRLMDLRNVPSPKKEDIVAIPGGYNEDGFRALCEKLAFRSILLDFDGFLRPFRQKLKQAA